jgi:hypothetical protein
VFRAGGYGQIICDDPQRAVVVDKLSGQQLPPETDSFTCRHCSRVVFVPVKADPATIGGMCYGCMGLICSGCVATGKCDPLEAKLERMERRQDTLRSYGMA